MKPSLLLALCFILTGAQAQNHVLGHIDHNEVRLVKDQKRVLNTEYQYQLRNQPNWQNFLLDNGTWYAHFNEANGKPHTAFGKPILVAGSNAVERAEYFVHHHLTGFGIPEAGLELMTTTSNEHFEQVFFAQRYQGRPVLFSKLSVKLTPDGKVISFGADVYDHIQVDEATVTPPSDGAGYSMAGISNSMVSVNANSELMILPVPEYERKRTIFRPVYEVTVNTMNEDRIPANYLTYVDAVDGKVWMRKDLVSHCESEPPGSASVDVTDDLSLTQPYDPETNSVLANMEVVQGGNTFYTDGSGHLNGLNSGTTTFRLRGLWSEVFTNGTTPSFNATLSNGANAIDWGINANSRESSAYYHREYYS
jgi:hypothetical protein